MSNSIRRVSFSLGVAILVVGGILTFTNRKNDSDDEQLEPPQVSQPPLESPPNTAKQKSSLLLGDQLLADYGKPSGTLSSDIRLFDRFLTNVFVLAKQRDPRHYATNEDLTLFLTGQKGNLTPYLSTESSLLNSEKQLIDRFGSPLIIHPLSKDQIEIRSSGPDRFPYTDDDVLAK